MYIGRFLLETAHGGEPILLWFKAPCNPVQFSSVQLGGLIVRESLEGGHVLWRKQISAGSAQVAHGRCLAVKDHMFSSLHCLVTECAHTRFIGWTRLPSCVDTGQRWRCANLRHLVELCGSSCPLHPAWASCVHCAFVNCTELHWVARWFGPKESFLTMSSFQQKSANAHENVNMSDSFWQSSIQDW